MRRPDSRNAIGKCISIFAEVRAGEGGTVTLFFVNAFIMMLLYYILKPVREGLIIAGFGAVVKSYSSAAQALLFAVVVPVYGACASRVRRVRLLSGMTLFFVSNLLLFALGLGIGFNIGIVFYIWLGLFNFMLISQFWAFANDLYTEDQGKRLFPVIGIGATAGALAGAWLTATVFERMSDIALILLACLLLLIFIMTIARINNRETRLTAGEAQKASETLSGKGGFQLILHNRYLLCIALYILLLNLVNTTGEFILGSLFQQAKDAAIAAGTLTQSEGSMFVRTMYAEFFGWVNLFGFLIQMLLVGRLIKYLGVRGTLFIGPLVSLATYGTTAAQPVMHAVRNMKIAENSNDYSTTNTVRAALFLVTSREVKYKAKAAIDTFFARGGDALQALVVFIGMRLSFAIPAFAIVNLAFIAVWMFVAGGIVREHKKLLM